MSGLSFNPDWAVPPGKTFELLLQRKHINTQDALRKLGFTRSNLQSFFKGAIEINEELANDLAAITATSVDFWLARESSFKEAIKKQNLKFEEEKSWLSAIGYSDMVKYGWLKSYRNHGEKIQSCLSYFKISSIDEWYETFKSTLHYAAFRTSSTYEQSDEAVISWIVQSENSIGNFSKIAKWNRDRLVELVPELRKLSIAKDPNVFIPKIKEILERCGVYFFVLPSPKGCKASGVVRYLESGNPTILLSGRYKSDDQFWFTFFHEIGHLVLHDDGGIKLEGIGSNELIEQEANEYSKNILIPREYQNEVFSLKGSDWRKIVRLSKRINLTPGIMLGQLQYSGNISHDYLNRLKTRYTWNEDFTEYGLKSTPK